MKEDYRSLRVFLCHSSEDTRVVEKFYNLLINDGVDAWLDKKNLIPGQNWQFEIQKAVKDTDIVIIFLSSASITKEGFVQREIKIILDIADEKPDGTIFIIPARLEKCNVPERLTSFQWVDLFEKDGYDQMFSALQIRAKRLGSIIKKNEQQIDFHDKFELRRLFSGNAGNSILPRRPSDSEQSHKRLVKVIDADATTNERDDQILNERELLNLADFLVRSGKAQQSSRRSLCIQIGIDPALLSSINLPTEQDFAVELVFHLYGTKITVLWKECALQ